jgi:NDP-sugar pyrophosphorylase family protein
VEAILLAGGKAERLGEAAGGRPKALVRVAGRPLAGYQAAALAAAGVTRLVVSCAAGQAALFEAELDGYGLEVVAAPEPERLGRGGGLRFASRLLLAEPPVLALNGDELADVDFGALRAAHAASGCAATITVVPLPTAFGVVDIGPNDRVTGFREAPRLPFWVSCGVYVLDAEALARLPEQGDHEKTTFPELAAAGRLGAFRHEGTWFTVNTPKDLRMADEYIRAHPEWLC